MKRLSLLATLATVSLLGVASLGSSAASADVLCSKPYFSYPYCPAAEEYPAGTKIFSGIRTSTHARLDPWLGAEKHVFDCNDGALVSEVTHAGSVGTNVEAAITDLTFASCDVTPTVVSPGNLYIVESPAGTTNGKAYMSNNLLKVYSEVFGTTCKVKIEGEGKITGPLWNGLGASTITFTNAKANAGLCGDWYYSAEYILTNPTSVYLSQF